MEGRRSTTLAVLVTLLVLAGCTEEPTGPRGPCPEGTQLNGDAPPKGQAQWCQRRARAFDDDAKVEDGWINHGPFRGWFQDGTVQARGTYEDGRMVGRFEMFFANGRRQVVVERQDGKRSGRSWSWHMGGHPAISAVFKAGKEDGPWVSWWEEGTTSAAGAMRDGWEDGMWSFWHPTGAPSHRGRYVLGKRQGWWQAWDAEGRAKPQILYEKNEEMKIGELSPRPDEALRNPPRPAPEFERLVAEWEAERQSLSAGRF